MHEVGSRQIATTLMSRCRFKEENMPLLAVWFSGKGDTPRVNSWLQHLIEQDLAPLQQGKLSSCLAVLTPPCRGVGETSASRT